MDPPRREFDGLLAECREQIGNNPENAGVRAYASQLDRVEIAGRDACETRNGRKWKTANETLLRLKASIERSSSGFTPPPPPPPPPPATLRAQAGRMIELLRSDLKTARDSRLKAGNSDRWERHCEDCASQIDHMATEIGKIKDETPNAQALAQVQSSLAPADKLRKKIGNILRGIVVET
jgi:hypothetical protein